MSATARLAVLSTIGLVAATLAAAPGVASAASLAAGHGRGHKILYPTVQAAAASRAARGAGAATVNGSGQLTYGGGVDGIGVSTGHESVYLVFWGSQWGTAGTDTQGNLTLSGDSKGMAPVLQRLFKGVGTGGETWSGVMTQYCEQVAVGTVTCPSSAPHVAYPTGGALAGVWYDSSASAPSQATDHQIGVEALNAITHFGGSSVALRNAQFVVVSPPGTHPGGFNTGFFGPQFCAWHDYNGDTTLNGGAVTSSYGDFSFTNMPYVTDLGTSCGQDYVNSGSAGTLDGVTIVEGHEYAETITDMNPAGGWLDSQQYENGDKCAWVGTGGSGGAQNVTFGTQGSFAMQGTYSDDSSSCLISHPIVTSGDVVTVTSPGAQTGTVGTAVTPLTLTASSSQSDAITGWSATGLPPGLSIGSSGTVSGTPTTAGQFSTTVTATDSAGTQGSATFAWSISAGNTVTVSSIPSQSTVQTNTATPVTPTAQDSTATATITGWSATGLPPGITISAATGTMSGTPTAHGTYTVTVTATDSLGTSGYTSFTWTVSPTTVTVNPQGPVSTPRNTTVTGPTMSGTTNDALTAPTALTWSATGLPPGVKLNSTTGTFSGKTGKQRRTYTVTVTAKDGTGSTGSTTFTWNVT